MYYAFAHRKYPSVTLNKDLYTNHSWKSLVKDDNSRGGFYVLEKLVVSEWMHNHGGAFYINAIRCLIWDRQSRTVSIIIEAFGDSDLRDAHTTNLFQLHPPREKRLVSFSQSYIVNTKTYKLCILRFPDTYFKPGYSYMFTYDGSSTAYTSDYEGVCFLSSFKSLNQLFSLQQQNCCFCSRDEFVVHPSNPWTWNRFIPRGIFSLQEEGRWGRVFEEGTVHEVVQDSRFVIEEVPVYEVAQLELSENKLGILTISAVMEGSILAKRVKEGDYLLAVNYEHLFRAEEVSQVLSARQGHSVQLTILRPASLPPDTHSRTQTLLWFFEGYRGRGVMMQEWATTSDEETDCSSTQSLTY